MIRRFNFDLLITMFLSLVCLPTLAADVITTVKGKKVVIDLDGSTPIKKGDTLTGTKGSKQATIVVSTVKKNKAVGNVKSGSAEKGMTVQKTGGATAKASKKKSSSGGTMAKAGSSGASQKGGMAFGVMAGYAIDSMSIKLVGTTADTKGSGFLLKGFVDLPMGSSMFIRSGLGWESFSTEGTISTFNCNGSNTCVVEMSFLTVDGFLGWNLMNGSTKFYLGGGAGLLFPISDNTNALSQDSIKQTASINFGFGMSFAFGKTMRMPVEFIYSMLPPSQDVSTTMMKIQGGISF